MDFRKKGKDFSTSDIKCFLRRMFK